MVNRSGAKALGPKTSIPMETYLQWVRARAQKLMMPHVGILPVIMEPTTEGGIPYTILYPDMPIDPGELQRSWIQLKKEQDTYMDQFYAQDRKVLELTKQLHEERGLNAYLGTKRKHPCKFLFFLVLDLFLIVTPKRNLNFEFR